MRRCSLFSWARLIRVWATLTFHADYANTTNSIRNQFKNKNSMQQNNYTNDERKRLLAYETAAGRSVNNRELVLRDPDMMTSEERQRFDGWQDIANGGWREEAPQEIATETDMTVDSPAFNDAKVSTAAEAASESATESAVPDADSLRRTALIKAGAAKQPQSIQSATMQQLRADYGTESLTMTADEQQAYDEMMQQMRLGNNATNATAINIITGLGGADGHDTTFDQVMTTNGVGAMMQDAKPVPESRMGLDVSEMVIASGVGNTTETALASQVESVRPLDDLGSDNLAAGEQVNASLEQARTAVDYVNTQQNYGVNTDGVVSDENEERLAAAEQLISPHH